MAVLFNSSGERLRRSTGTFLSPLADFTALLTVQPVGGQPTSGQYRTFYVYDSTGAAYLWVGQLDSGVLSLYAEDGTNIADISTGAALTVDAWTAFAVVYDATAKTIALYQKNGTSVTLVGSATLDLSAITVEQELLGDDGAPSYSNIGVAMFRSWQRKLTADQIAAEMRSWCVVETTDLFQNNPLVGINNYQDASGNGRTWSATGVLSTITGPAYMTAPSIADGDLIVGGSSQSRTFLASNEDGTIRDNWIPLGGFIKQAAMLLPSKTWGAFVGNFSIGQSDKLRIVDQYFNRTADAVDVFPIADFDNNHAYYLSSNWADTFYVGKSGFSPLDPEINNVFAAIRQVSSAGVVGGTTWTLPHVTMAGFAVNLAGTVAYYIEDSESLYGTRPNLSPIHRFDLVNNVALSDLVVGAEGPAAWGTGIWVHPTTGHLFLTYQADRDVEAWTLRRYHPTTGVLLGEYTIPSDVDNAQNIDPLVGLDISNPNRVWTWSYVGTTDEVTIAVFDLTTGSMIDSFTAAVVSNTGWSPDNGVPFFAQSVDDSEESAGVCVTAPVRVGCWNGYDPTVQQIGLAEEGQP